MARLRREPVLISRVQQLQDEDEDIPLRPARTNGRVPDDSSAEESEQPAKLVQKQKSAGVKKQGHVKLGTLRSGGELSGKPAGEVLGEPKRPRRPRKPVELEISAEPEPVEQHSPERVEEVDEEDVKESIWCQSLDDSDSDASSVSDLPNPRKFIKFAHKTSDKPFIEPSRTAPKPDFAKQFQALSIFDDDDTITASKLRSKKSETLSRPGSSSDKENNNAIIRFSPPRPKSPGKRVAIGRPSTPPPPPSPSKTKLQSPSKRAVRIPTPPLRQSLDAFWTADTINDWNDQYSPQKPLKSPRKLKPQPQPEDYSPTTSPNKSRSPGKRTKAELQAKKDFEIEKITLAESFLCELDEKITQGQISTLSASTGGVQLIWSKTLNSTAGRANWRRETTKTRSASGTELSTVHKHFASIELASKVISTPDRLLNVIAHEFCHLANFMISGIKDQPHGKSFKAWGAKVSRVFGGRGVEVTTKHTYEIEYKYVWSCQDEECGVEFKRHSKSIDPGKHRCGVCKGMLVQVKPVPRKGNGSGTPTLGSVGGKAAATPVTGYAAFVKEHFAGLKKSMQGASHKEVMEALGKKYRAEKAGAKSDSIDSLAKDLESVKLGSKVEIIELD